MKYKFITGVTIGTLFLIGKAPSKANSTTLEIYPPLLKITADPRADISIPLTISNNSNEEKLISIEFIGFRAGSGRNQSHEYYTDKNTPQSLSTLLKSMKVFDGEEQIKSIKLYPYESKNVSLTFKAPFSASDYYFSPLLTYTHSDKNSDKNTSIEISQSVASNVLLSVRPLDDAQSSISELSVPMMALSSPVKAKIEVRNDSKNFTTLTGSVSLYNLAGKQVYTKQIPETIVLSNSTKQISDSSSTEGIITIPGDHIGIYTLRVDLKSGKESFSESAHIVYIPFLLLTVIIILLFLILSLGFKIIKKLNFKQP